jgi:hypothetical protein
MAEQVSAILSAGLTPEQLSTVLSAVLILEYVTKVPSGTSTAEMSQVVNASAVRETSARPTASVRRHCHHRANVSTLTGDAEVPSDKTRRIHRHRESGRPDSPAEREAHTGIRRGNRPPHQERHRRSREGVIEGEARNAQRVRQLLSERRDQPRSRKLHHQTKHKCEEVTGWVTGCDGGRRKGRNSRGHENCTCRQNTNATKGWVLFVVAVCLLIVAPCLLLIRFCSLL